MTTKTPPTYADLVAQVEEVPFQLPGLDHEPAIGEVVKIDSKKFPGLWKVVKKNKTTYGLVNPKGQNLRADRWSMLPTDEEFVEDATPALEAGMVVRFLRDGTKVKTTDRYVVLKAGVTNVQIAKLGGDGNRYYPKVNPGHLVIVPVSDL